MADIFQDKRFRECIKLEYENLLKKAETKAICSYNNGNTPKKKLIEQFKSHPDFQNRVERYKRELHVQELADMLASEETLERYGKGEKYIRLYNEYCSRHETEEEKRTRLERERIMLENHEKIMAEYSKYLEEYDYDEKGDAAAEVVAEKMIEKVKEHFLHARIDIADYKRSIYSNYWNYYKDEEELSAENIGGFIDDICDESGDKLNSEYIEYVTHTEWFSSGVSDVIIENDKYLSEMLEYDGPYDELYYDFIERCGDYDIEQKPFEIVSRFFTRGKILELLMKNPYVKEIMKEKDRIDREKKKIESDIIDSIPESVTDLFPAARRMNREFILHIGPTNSGKTYAAIEEMKSLGGGIYLGPLRLLAFEQYEKLNAEGFPCSLITGEERAIVESSLFTASTIEMADFKTEYNYAVVDEAQMICDESRGGAWTSVILGLLCKKISLCLSEEAEELVIHLIEMCGDKYSIVRHERKTPLIVEDTKFKFPDNVQDGDALIVFSRKNVHAVVAELQKKHVDCSIIYGALPYNVRHEQARKFAAEESRVVVATDAIGMGMNLPIKRVVFLEISKFDGTKRRLLNPSEIKQIAGRAGRFGINDKGYVNSEVERKRIRTAVEMSLPQIKTAVIAFPESLIDIDGKLSDIIEKWIAIEDKEGFNKENLTEKLELCKFAEGLIEDKRDVYNLISLPFDSKNEVVKELWERIVISIANIHEFDIKKAIPTIKDKWYDTGELDFLETAHKICDLLYAFCDKYKKNSYIEEILGTKLMISDKITHILDRQELNGKRCKYCGRLLAWNYPYGMCSKCHDKIYSRYNYDDDFCW